MRTDDEIEADFGFIIQEIIRFSAMTWEELVPHLQENGLFEITDAAGSKRILGRQASGRLFALTEEALAASPFNQRVDPDRAYRAVSDGLGKHFIHGGYKAPTAEELRLRLAEWIEAAGAECAPRTHLVPCNIGLRGQDEVVLGPVKITSRSAVWERLSEPLARYQADEDDAERRFRENSVEAANHYYSAFLDIAEVTIPNCDGPTSKAAAAAAVQAALDFIHVAAGAGYTSKMRSGGPPITDRRGEIEFDAAGDVSITSSSRWGGAFLGEEWWQSFDDLRGRMWIRSVGTAIQSIVDRTEPKLLADRFLDGCSWFGDASREPSHAAAIVKYLTAIERLLWAGEKGPGVTKRIADRAAALCFTTETWNMEEIAIEVREAYDIRSAILHGRVSKNHPLVARQLRKCERRARELLHTWIDRYGPGFGQPVSVEGLKAYLDGFVADAREECARQLAQSPPEAET